MKPYKPKESKWYLTVIWVYFFITLIILLVVIWTAPKAQSTENRETNAVEVIPVEKKKIEGVASWYSYKINTWDSSKHNVCASRDFPRYSIVKVTNIENGLTSWCEVTDWIEHSQRVIDLSPKVFNEVSDTKKGLFKVKVEEI